jgi:hypothetical protein
MINFYVSPRIAIILSLLEIKCMVFVGLCCRSRHQSIENCGVSFNSRTKYFCFVWGLNWNISGVSFDYFYLNLEMSISEDWLSICRKETFLNFLITWGSVHIDRTMFHIKIAKFTWKASLKIELFVGIFQKKLMYFSKDFFKKIQKFLGKSPQKALFFKKLFL